MKILVTGSSGFIGYHLARELLKKNNQVIGIDNNNNYYSNVIKKNRLKKLKKYKNFFFHELNIVNQKKLAKIFKKHKPSIVIHLAGQPGVLYSLKNPGIYLINNVAECFIIIMFMFFKLFITIYWFFNTEHCFLFMI